MDTAAMNKKDKSAEADHAAALLRASWDQMIARLEEAETYQRPEALSAACDAAQLGRRLPLRARLSLWFPRALPGAHAGVPLLRARHPAAQPLHHRQRGCHLPGSAHQDGNYRYTIRGRTGDTRHWRGELAVEQSPKAPHYVIFQTPSGYSGDTGGLDELKPGTRVNCAVLNSPDIQVNADGTFQILLGPEKPAGYKGNFMLTRAVKTRKNNHKGESITREYVSEFVVLRELFGGTGRTRT